MVKFKIPLKIKRFASVFHQNGFSLYVVGGAVRDYFLSIKNDDYDFATDARPSDVIKIFSRVIPTGLQHGTVTVRFEGESYEVTTFRTEGGYSDSRHPDNVTFVTDINEDLSRRDFTVNAIACDCSTGCLIDNHAGLEDLKNKVIRAIGNPEERFTEDPLRMLRAFRFASKLNAKIDNATLQAIKKLAANIRTVSSERIQTELEKTLASSFPGVGLRGMNSSKLMDYILPECTANDKVQQDRNHKYDVLEHIFRTTECSAIINASLNVRLASLFHDIGKVKVIDKKDGHYTFYRHEIISAELTFAIMNRLKFPLARRNAVVNLVKNHMFFYTSEWTDGAVKRFINRVGKENLNDLFDLRTADHMAIFGDRPDLSEFQDRIRKVENHPLSLKDLNINGQDLSALGVPKNNIMGKILQDLLEYVLDNPEINNKPELQSIALKKLKFYS